MLPTLVAGSGTARSPIGNGMPALLRHPAQMQRLRGERHLLEPSVNVWRRCDGPFPLDGSVVRKDPQVCGRGLRTGKTAIVLLGVASRDPQDVRELRGARHRAEGERPSFLRVRHSALSQRCAGTAGGSHRTPWFARSFPVDQLGDRFLVGDGIVLRSVEIPWIALVQARRSDGA